MCWIGFSAGGKKKRGPFGAPKKAALGIMEPAWLKATWDRRFSKEGNWGRWSEKASCIQPISVS